MAPMTSAVMSSVETRHAGVASAATNTSRELGGVFGIALLGAIVTSSFRHGLVSRLVAGGIPAARAATLAAAAGGRSSAGAAPPGGGPVVAAVHLSFVHAIHIAMIVGVAFMLLASVVSAIFVRSHVEGGTDGGSSFGH